MKRNIELARDNAKVSADEILYLRQQLVIGGSTLDSVLSAEARLYEAEAKKSILPRLSSSQSFDFGTLVYWFQPIISNISAVYIVFCRLFSCLIKLLEINKFMITLIFQFKGMINLMQG